MSVDGQETAVDMETITSSPELSPLARATESLFPEKRYQRLADELFQAYIDVTIEKVGEPFGSLESDDFWESEAELVVLEQKKITELLDDLKRSDEYSKEELETIKWEVTRRIKKNLTSQKDRAKSFAYSRLYQARELSRGLQRAGKNRDAIITKIAGVSQIIADEVREICAQIDSVSGDSRSIKEIKCPELYKRLSVVCHQYMGLQDLIKPEDKDDFAMQSDRMSRRSFLLRTGALATLGLSAAISAKILRNKNTLAHLEQLFARQDPGPEFGERSDYEVRDALYKEHFDSEIFSFQEWQNICNSFDEILSQHYHRLEAPTESYDDFFFRQVTRFLDSCEEFGVSKALAATLTIISAENTGMYHFENNYQRDVTSGKVQVAASILGDLLGSDAGILEAISATHGFKRRIARFAHNELPINHYDVVRFTGPLTIGLHDIEAQLLVDAMTMNPILGQDLKTSYPAQHQVLEELGFKKQKLEEKRDSLEALVDSYLTEFSYRILSFTSHGDRERSWKQLEEIGISEEKVDDWQKVNPTAVWVHMAEHQGGLAATSSKSAEADIANSAFLRMEDWRYSMNSDIQAAKTFVSQQIHNPKFLPYLISSSVDQKEQMLLHAIKLAEDEFLEASEEYDVADAKAITSLSAVEYDLNFQMKTGAGFFGVLQKRALGYFSEAKMNSRDGMLFALFVSGNMRDITSVTMLTEGAVFARFPRVDAVYDYESTLDTIFKIIFLLERGGYLTMKPWQDFKAFFSIFKELEYNPIYSNQDDSIHDSMSWSMARNLYLKMFAPHIYSSLYRAKSICQTAIDEYDSMPRD